MQKDKMKIDVITLVSYSSLEPPTSYICETIKDFRDFMKREMLDISNHDLDFLKEIDTYKSLSDIDPKSLESFLNSFGVESDEEGDGENFGGFMLFINGRYA